MSCDPITYDIKPHYSSYFPVQENDSAEFYVSEIQHTSLGSDISIASTIDDISIKSAEINWTLSKTSSACNLQKFGVDNLR